MQRSSKFLERVPGTKANKARKLLELQTNFERDAARTAYAMAKAVVNDDELPHMSGCVRNYVFIGEGRVGKNTCLNVLRNTFYDPPPPSLFVRADDLRSTSHSYAVCNTHDAQDTLVMNVLRIDIDMDEMKVDKKKKSSRHLDDTLQKCLERKIARLHGIVLFVDGEEGGVSQDHMLLLATLAKMLSSVTSAASGGSRGALPHLALCLTHGEQRDADWRQRTRQTILSQPTLRDLSSHCDLSVLFTGAVTSYALSTATEDSALHLYRQVIEMRDEFLSWAFKARNSIDVIRIPAFENVVNSLRGIICEATGILKKFDAKLRDNPEASLLSEDVAIQMELLRTIAEQRWVLNADTGTKELFREFVRVGAIVLHADLLPDDLYEQITGQRTFYKRDTAHNKIRQ